MIGGGVAARIKVELLIGESEESRGASSRESAGLGSMGEWGNQFRAEHLPALAGRTSGE